MSTAVVTGASGHVGANLVRALATRGRSVRCLVRDDARAIEGLAVERVRGDLSDAGSLERAFAGASTVFHCAAVISIAGGRGGAVERANVEGVRHVLAACRGAGVKRLVHFSSIEALQDGGAQTDEDAPLASGAGLSPYERSKAEGEALVLAARDLEVVVVTPTAVIGPFDFKPSRSGQALLDMARGKTPALLRAGMDWVDVRDVAEGALAAEARGTSGRRYLLSGTRKSLAEVAALVHACGGARPPRMVLPVGVAAAVAPLALLGSRLLGQEPLFTPEAIAHLRAHLNVVPRRSVAELAWAPRPIANTIADTLGWFRQNGNVW